jgi:hypothetical protein
VGTALPWGTPPSTPKRRATKSSAPRHQCQLRAKTVFQQNHMSRGDPLPMTSFFNGPLFPHAACSVLASGSRNEGGVESFPGWPGQRRRMPTGILPVSSAQQKFQSLRRQQCLILAHGEVRFLTRLLDRFDFEPPGSNIPALLEVQRAAPVY